MIEYNVLGTYEFNRRDIHIANKIFGPNQGALREKWTKRPNKMERPGVEIATDIPEEVLSEYRDVHLDVDMMYANGIGFLTVISWDLRLVHCQCLQRHKGDNILETLYDIINEYADRGFAVVSMYGDR